MDWTLGPAPAALRVTLGAVAAASAASAAGWVALSLAEGEGLQALVAALSLAAVAPVARAARDRRDQGRLRRDADGRWSDDRLGPIASPRVVVDGGTWLLLRLQALPPHPAVRWVATEARSVRTADAWTARRRVLRADAGRLGGAAP